MVAHEASGRETRGGVSAQMCALGSGSGRQTELRRGPERVARGWWSDLVANRWRTGGSAREAARRAPRRALRRRGRGRLGSPEGGKAQLSRKHIGVDPREGTRFGRGAAHARVAGGAHLLGRRPEIELADAAGRAGARVSVPRGTGLADETLVSKGYEFKASNARTNDCRSDEIFRVGQRVAPRISFASER